LLQLLNHLTYKSGYHFDELMGYKSMIIRDMRIETASPTRVLGARDFPQFADSLEGLGFAQKPYCRSSDGAGTYFPKGGNGFPNWVDVFGGAMPIVTEP
jgi:hypothetical protein